MKAMRNLLALLLAFSCMAVPLSGAYAADFGDSQVEASTSGWTTVETPIYFSSAEVLTLTTTDGSYSTSAVSDNGSLTFYAQQAGTYTVDRTGDDVWSKVGALPTGSLLRHISDRQSLRPQVSDLEEGGLLTWRFFNPYRSSARDETHGTADEPVTALVHFVGQGNNPEDSLELNKQSANGLIGYKTGSDNADAAEAGRSSKTDFAPSYLLVEDRNEDTGKLIASVLFTPDANERPAGLDVAGDQAFNLVVDPGKALLEDRLATNSTYENNASLCSEAVSCVVEAEKIDDLVMLANLDTMCAYATGEKTYTLDIATLSNEDTKAGEEVVLTYYLGAGDENACTGSISSFESDLESTRKTYTVDENGYVTFSLYGGGIYALGSEKAVSSLPAVPSAGTGGTTGNGGSGSSGNSNSEPSNSGLMGTTDTGTDGISSVGSGTSSSGSDSSFDAPLAASSATPVGSSATTPLTQQTGATNATSPRSTSSSPATAVEATDGEDGVAAGPLASAAKSNNSSQKNDEAAEESGEESIGFPLSLFFNEDGSLNVTMVVLAAAVVAAIAAVVTLLIRRRILHNREAAAETLAAETGSAAAITQPSKAQAAQDIPDTTQTPDEAASSVGVAAATSGAAAGAASASATKMPETLEEKIKRRAARRVSNTTSQFVGDNAKAGDVLAQLMGAKA